MTHLVFKMKYCKIIQRFSYGADTWTRMKKEEQALLIF